MVEYTLKITNFVLREREREREREELFVYRMYMGFYFLFFIYKKFIAFFININFVYTRFFLRK